MAAKRVQTDEIYASSMASNIPSSLSSATPPDLAAQLRAVGMRARKHVMEGYATNRDPGQATASSRMKALSTGSIFCSANDALHDASVSSSAASNFSGISRKRQRSEDDQIDNDDSDAQGQPRVDVESMLLDHKDLTERPVKPLRKSNQALTQSRSLPAGALFTGQLQSRADHHDNVAEKDLQAEEDWSESSLNKSFGGSSFEPMVL